jgi:hypothetical protein
VNFDSRLQTMQLMKGDLQENAGAPEQNMMDFCNVCVRPVPAYFLPLSGPRGCILRCIIRDAVCDTYENL